MGKRPYEEIGGVRFYDNPLVDGVTDRRVFVTEPPPKKGATPIKKGVEFDCGMYDVRCTQECASGGLRHTSDCPYDNYKGNPKIPKGYQGTYAKNSDGGATLIMVTSEQEISKKGATKMAKPTTKPAPANNGGKPFTPTFKKYADMNKGEQEAFKQGASMVNNNVKERLGLKKPKQ